MMRWDLMLEGEVLLATTLWHQYDRVRPKDRKSG